MKPKAGHMEHRALGACVVDASDIEGQVLGWLLMRQLEVLVFRADQQIPNLGQRDMPVLVGRIMA